MQDKSKRIVGFPVPEPKVAPSAPFRFLDFDVGTTSVRMGRYQLTGGDAMAQAAVVDRLIKQILAGWPRTAYAGEIRRLVRVALCESAGT